MDGGRDPPITPERKITLKSICLDIDGVITDIAGGIDSALSKQGIYNLDYTHWLVEKYEDDLTIEIFNDKLFWINLKPFEDAWYQINNWWSSGIDVHLVTARYSKAGKDSLNKWLDNWKLAYTSLHFAEMGNKLEVIKSLDCSFMVEDNFNEIAKLTSNGIKCYMRKNWYNKSYWNKYTSIDTLFDLKEIDD